MSRRCYNVWIPPETVMTLLGGWRHHEFLALPWLERATDANGNRVDLPPDYRITDATFDWYRRAIGLRIEHESFPEVPDGEHCPPLYFREVTIRAVKVRNPDAGEDDLGPIIVEVPPA
jgi:hypothetical protein